MPPKRVSQRDSSTPRVIPYDLRRTHIPRVGPPPPPGEKRSDTYVPRKTGAATAAIRNEARKRGIPRAKKPRTPAKSAGTAPTSTPSNTTPAGLAPPPARTAPASSAVWSTSRPRSRSVSQPAQHASSKRVRFTDLAMASGALNPNIGEEEGGDQVGSDELEALNRSSPPSTFTDEDNITTSDVDDNAEEEDNITLPPPLAPPHQPAPLPNPSSDPDATEAAAEAAAEALYAAKERYKELIHKKKVAEARHAYVDLRTGPMETSELEEELEEAMRDGDFYIQYSLHLPRIASSLHAEFLVKQLAGRSILLPLRNCLLN